MTSAFGVALIAFFFLTLAYFTYGRFLAGRVFQLNPNARTPSHELEDGIDFVPTKVPVLFGHHFASIAGLGPILGPAIAVIWGWLPAVIWVVVGCIVIGAVHDLGALTVSARHKGRSVGDVCRELMSPRARLLFLCIIFLAMSLAMGSFIVAISELFVFFRPDAIIPSGGLMIVAVGVGIAVYKLKWSLGPITAVAVAIFLVLIAIGVIYPVSTYEMLLPTETQSVLAEAKAAGDPAFAAPYGSASAEKYLAAHNHEGMIAEVHKASVDTKFYWMYSLLFYGFLASVLPVWLLLQPRDYINSFQLYAALSLLVIGLAVVTITGAEQGHIHAEPIRANIPGAPPMFPFLLVTIACGAVSGFHSLVSSGTTVRQLDKEPDALPVGYGSMLVEGALAILIILALVAGLGPKAWEAGGAYSSWGAAKGDGLAIPLNAVVNGAAQFLHAAGLPMSFAQGFLAVTIVAFALTTLDSGTRLLRFNVEEIFRSLGLDVLANRYLASLLAVIGIGFFGMSESGKSLWTLFGTTNQLLAGLTLLTVSVYLYKTRRPVIYTLLPMCVMMVISIWAMGTNVVNSLTKADPKAADYTMAGVSSLVICMAVWLTAEGILSFMRGRDAGPTEPPVDSVGEEEREVASATHLG